MVFTHAQFFFRNGGGPILKTLGILMVATNSYLERWKNGVLSIEQHLENSELQIKVHLFTNLESEAKAWSQINLINLAVCIHQIPAYGWPEATLLRYRFFDSEKEHLAEDLLMYMDSDLIVKSDFSKLVYKSAFGNRIVLVDHPGFARSGPHRGPFALNWLRNFPFFEMRVNRILEKLQRFGLWRGNARFQAGSWETNSNSTAYVPWLKRRQYFYGAIWFGKNDVFQNMCKLLRQNVDMDLKSGIIAVWHDESHLNWFAANHGCKIASKDFCTSEENQLKLKALSSILALTKNPGEGRNPSSEGLRLL